MELVELYRSQPEIPHVGIRLPWRVRIVLGVLTMFIVSVAFVMAAAPREIADPFSAFSDLLGEDVRLAAMARGFTCRFSGFRNRYQGELENCTQRDPDGIFSRLYLWISNSIANEIGFSLREHSLTLGDLAALWGKPEVLHYCETAVAFWPDRLIMSIVVPPRSGRISYFAPVVSVSFTRGGLPRLKRMLMNDARDGCT